MTDQLDDPIVHNSGLVLVATAPLVAVTITVSALKVFAPGSVEEDDGRLEKLFSIVLAVSVSIWQVCKKVRSDGGV